MSGDVAFGTSVEALARPVVRNLEPYAWEASNLEIAERFGIDAAQVVRFDTNTSPLPPPCFSAVLHQIEADPCVNEYFDSTYALLSRALSNYIGCEQDNLVIGAGADEILDILAKTFLNPGDVVVVPTPTYAMYRIVAQTMDANVAVVPATPDLAFDVDAIISAARKAKMVLLCNPNNPTGLRLPSSEVERLVRSVDCLVVVDEAYAEFSGESVVPLVRSYERLIVVRTLSKAFSIAGARVGYAVCAPQVAGLANRVRPPQSVSHMSAVLGEAVVKDIASMRANVASLIDEREWLAGALQDLGLDVTPSHANFVLVRLPSPQRTATLHGACLSKGLVIRSYDGNPVLASYLRITARSHAENQRLIEALRAAL